MLAIRCNGCGHPARKLRAYKWHGTLYCSVPCLHRLSAVALPYTLGVPDTFGIRLVIPGR